MKNNYSKNIGSVSTATMRPEDLIPDFIYELRTMKPLRREHRQLIREIERNMNRKTRNSWAIQQLTQLGWEDVCAEETRREAIQRLQEYRDNQPGYAARMKVQREPNNYFDSEDANWDLEALFDALDEYALPYMYFGAHPGDGSDYGFWLSEYFEDSFESDGGLKVSDLSEVPTAHTGEVLLVNDHGNTSLYAYSRGRGRTIWEVV